MGLSSFSGSVGKVYCGTPSGVLTMASWTAWEHSIASRYSAVVGTVDEDAV